MKIKRLQWTILNRELNDATGCDVSSLHFQTKCEYSNIYSKFLLKLLVKRIKNLTESYHIHTCNILRRIIQSLQPIGLLHNNRTNDFLWKKKLSKVFIKWNEAITERKVGRDKTRRRRNKEVEIKIYRN